MSISKLGLGNQILSDTSKVDSLKMELRLQVERVEKEKQYNFRNTKLFQAQCLCQSATEDGFFDQETIDEAIFAPDKIQTHLELNKISKMKDENIGNLDIHIETDDTSFVKGEELTVFVYLNNNNTFEIKVPENGFTHNIYHHEKNKDINYTQDWSNLSFQTIPAGSHIIIPIMLTVFI